MKDTIQQARLVHGRTAFHGAAISEYRGAYFMAAISIRERQGKDRLVVEVLDLAAEDDTAVKSKRFSHKRFSKAMKWAQVQVTKRDRKAMNKKRVGGLENVMPGAELLNVE